MTEQEALDRADAYERATSAERARATEAWRQYHSLLTYWYGVHALVAAADEDDRQRRRAERLPVAFPDDVWDRVPVWSASPPMGRWERSTWMRARS